jgi:hypothetical protein
MTGNTTLIEQRSGNKTASLSNIMKTLVQRIQEAMDRAEQGIRLVEILPVSVDPNGSQALGEFKRASMRRSEPTDEMRAS